MPSINPCVDAAFTDEERSRIFQDEEITDELVVQRLNRIAQEAEGRSRQAKLQAIAIHRSQQYISGFEHSPKEALANLIAGSWKSRAGIVSAERHIDAVLGDFHADLAPMLEAYRPRKLGFQHSSIGPRNTVREMFGQATGDADAAAYAKIWRQTLDNAMRRFNKAGGMVADLETWALPQYHNPKLVGGVDYEEWLEYINSKIDVERTYTQRGIDIGGDEYRRITRYIYDKIRTDGLSALQPGKLPPWVRGAIGNRHQESRFFHFKGGDEWLAYQERFGQGKIDHTDVWSIMTSHLGILAREIGLMEKFGPNPDASYKYLSDTVKKQVGEKDFPMIDAMWNNLSGKTYAHNVPLAQAISGIRSFSTAIKLGMAALSAIPDAAFMAATARYNSMPIVRLFSRFIRNLATNQDKQVAARLGLTAEYAMNHAAAASRLAEITGYETAARFADITVRATGLNHWTVTGRATFGLEMLQNFANYSDRTWRQLRPRFRKSLQRYGITGDDWEVMRRSMTTEDGVTYMDPRKFDNPDLQSKVVGAIIEEQHLAVPEPGVRSRAITNLGQPAGTIHGEMIRSFTALKSFPVTILTSHFGRAIGERGLNRLSYISSLVAGTTVLGAVALQSKHVVTGKETEDWNSSNFWVRSMLAGGSFGIMGDFLLKDANDYQTSLPEDIAGPVVSDFEKIVSHFTFGSLAGFAEALGGGDLTTDEARDRMTSRGASLLQQLAPGRLWYTKLMMDRMMFDQLNKLADPRWDRKQRRKERKMAKRDQDYWWEPGKFQPEF